MTIVDVEVIDFVHPTDSPENGETLELQNLNGHVSPSEMENGGAMTG